MASQSVIQVVINAKDNASKALKSFSKNTVQASKVATKALLGLSAAAGFALGIAIKKAAAFETKLADVSTLLSGDSTKAINQFKEGILDMMSRVPVSADELGASVYAIVSAGITDTAKALRVLEKSAELGTAGLGTTEEATTLMVLAMNNFADSGVDADKAAQLMFKTVKAGITNISDLSQSFGLVAPLAVDAGVSLEELQAATAALTQVNKSASISQNSLKAALVSLAKPTESAQELFEGLGVKTFPELIKKSGGMVAAFKAMQKQSKGNTQQFAKAIGSGEALTSVISLLGEQSDSFKESLASMKGGTDDLTEAFEKQKKTATNSFKLLRNAVDKLAIKVGSKLLPPLAKFVTILAENIEPSIKKVTRFLKEHKQVLFIVAGIIAAVVTPAFVAWGIAAVTAATATIVALAPLVALGATIGGIAFLIFKAWNENWGGIRDITVSAMNTIMSLTNETLIPAFKSAREKVDEIVEAVTKFSDKLIEIKDGALDFFRNKLKEIEDLILRNKEALIITSGILLATFGPALVVAGGKAGIAAGILATKLVLQIIDAGNQAVIAAIKISVNLVKAFILSSFHAVAAAAKYTISTVALVGTKIAAIALGGAKVIAALTRFAIAGWAAVGPWGLVALGVLAVVGAIAALTNELEKLGLIGERFNVLKQLKSLPGFFGAAVSGRLAEGTEFSKSGSFLVGERGPEIVNLPAGSQVTPNNQLQGGGDTFNITLNVGTLIDSDTTRRNFVEKMMQDIENIAAMKGKKVNILT